MKVYISGPLHQVPNLEEARGFYEFLASVCREAGCDPYLPHQRTDPERNRAVDPVDVFAWDYDALSSADLIVAVIGHPSSGVGAELGIAYERGIPVIGLHAATERPSRFLVGMLKQAPGSLVLSYQTTEECAAELRHNLMRRLVGAEIRPLRYAKHA